MLFFVCGIIHSLIYLMYQAALAEKGGALKCAILSFTLDAYSTIATIGIIALGLEDGIISGITYALGGALITYAYKKRS